MIAHQGDEAFKMHLLAFRDLAGELFQLSASVALVADQSQRRRHSVSFDAPECWLFSLWNTSAALFPRPNRTTTAIEMIVHKTRAAHHR